MVFDAHDKAFAFYGGVCRRGIYDNMKTAVDAVFVGRGRTYNRRFLQMCSHHLVEPTACTPASGWEKGQVENQVGTMRDVLFRPRPKVKTLEELNAWLEDQCRAYAQRTPPAVQGPDHLGGVRGGARRPGAVRRSVRRLQREADARHDHLPDHP
jgi:transposase